MPWPMTTSFASDATSSSVKTRPSEASLPRMRKKPAETRPAGTASGSPSPAIARSDGQMPSNRSRSVVPFAESIELERRQRIRRREVGRARRLQVDAQQSIGVWERQRTKERGVGDREHGADRRDDDGDGQQAAGEQSGALAEHPHRDSEVLYHRRSSTAGIIAATRGVTCES